jgi:uncharacterized membrane protein YraQ (UPF0718 family)
LLTAIGHALMMSFAILWEILWALILGFSLSAVIQAVVSKEEMSRLLPDDCLGICTWCGIIVLLLCCPSVSSLHVPQRGKFHVGNGLSVRIH